MTDEFEPSTDDDRLAVGLFDVLELIAPGAQVTGWERLPGGIASDVHRIDVTMPSGARTSFVVRRLGPGHDGADARREARTLEALRGTHVKAPEMLWLDTDGAVFGRPSMAQTLVPGAASVEPRDVGRWTASLAEALAALHLVPASMVDHLPRVDSYEDMVSGAVASAAGADPAYRLEEVAKALHGAIPDVRRAEVRLVHGDYHAANVLRGDDELVTGVLDWMMAFVGDPMRDVGYCHYDTTLLLGPEVADAFVERYEVFCGRDTSTLWWWGLLAVCNSLPRPSHWMDAHRALGATVTEDRVTARAVAYVDRMLDERASATPSGR